jgi:hypothetical protein
MSSTRIRTILGWAEKSGACRNTARKSVMSSFMEPPACRVSGGFSSPQKEEGKQKGMRYPGKNWVTEGFSE